MIGFKVFRNFCCRNISFYPATCNADYRVQYHLHKTTTQEEYEQGPFAVFDNLLDAYALFDLLQNPYDLFVFLVEYEPSKSKTLWHERQNLITKNQNFPTGTKFARKITPLSQIPYYSNIQRKVLMSLPVIQ